MRTIARLAIAPPLVAVLIAATSGTAAAHVVSTDGPYTVAMGWLQEPAYVGSQNAVQVIIKDSKGSPVADLASGALTVVVSTGGQQTAALPLDPSLDPDTGLGRPGEYLAWLVPTVPGDYTFHLTGSIHGQNLDETYTSSDTTFNAVEDPTAAQFPAKLPTVTELAARSDRADARVADALAGASSASSDASRALVVGATLGGAGLVVAIVALAMALRSRRRVA